MNGPRSIGKKGLLAAALAFVALLPVAQQAFGQTPGNFQWRSYDGTGSTAYGVYDSDNVTPLAGGDLLQLIWVGPDGEIDLPDASGTPSDDDAIIATGAVMQDGTLPGQLQDHGYFDEISSYDRSEYPDGTIVYVRAWNASTASDGSSYGESATAPLADKGVHNFPRWYIDSQPTAVTVSSFRVVNGPRPVVSHAGLLLSIITASGVLLYGWEVKKTR